MKASTIQNCWKKASFFEENYVENLNVDVTEIAEEEECVSSLSLSVSDYQKSSNLSFSLNAEDFLNSDNDVLVFSDSSDEEIIAEITSDQQNDEEEAVDCSHRFLLRMQYP